MFASDQQAGTLDLVEFREMWNFVDRWKAIFDEVNRGLPMTVDKFQPALDALGFRFVNKYSKMKINRSRYSMELSDDLFRRFNHSHTAVLVLDEFIHCIIVLQKLNDGITQYDQNGTKTQPEAFIFAVLAALY